MDKQGNKISIKINGSERSFTTEKTTWKKPAQDEICATQEEEVFSWRQPEDEEPKEKEADIIDFSQLKKSSRTKALGKRLITSANKRIQSAIVSVFTAVIVGTAFGFVVLNLIPKQKEHFLSDEKNLSQPLVSIEKENNKETKAEPVSPTTKDGAPVLNVHVIQAGAFSETKSANEYVQKLKNLGIPAVAVGEKPTYLLIGIGGEKEALQPVSELYKEKGQDTYIKPLSLKEATDARTNELLATSQSLYETIASLSAQELGGNTPGAEAWSAVEKSYKQWKVRNVLDNRDAKKYVSHLEKAYAFFHSYREKRDTTLLWKCQQELLEALKYYMALTSA